jgi:NAD(P)-dependent dehydrogenase (short-subunit alcohol dehydrogenase family)
MATYDLAGRVAIVTGAGRGIGRTVARTLAEQGMLVGVNDLDAVAAEAAADELRQAGHKALALPASVSTKAEVVAMLARAEAELGPLWLLVNNAGVFTSAPTTEMSEEDWERTFAVDAKGVFLCSQAALAVMLPRGKGRIVNFGSIAGQIVRTGQIAYCAAKAAVIHFTRCLAVEVASQGVTVNCLCPGMTWTDMLVRSTAARGLDVDAMVEMIPAGRMASEEDHANLVCYFASDEAGRVTGQVVSVDGAQSLYHPLMAKR